MQSDMPSNGSVFDALVIMLQNESKPFYVLTREEVEQLIETHNDIAEECEE